MFFFWKELKVNEKASIIKNKTPVLQIDRRTALKYDIGEEQNDHHGIFPFL